MKRLIFPEATPFNPSGFRTPLHDETGIPKWLRYNITAFIPLESDNPKFLFLIRKNPAASMIVKQLRHGLLFGYYSK